MRIPADYVKHHLELGYAVTSHRAQGITTDTAHVVVTAGMTRENLYVAMTRGREANTAFVAIDRPDVAHVGPRSGHDKDATARSVLWGVLQHVGAEQSASETIVAQQDAWFSVAQLAAEYETIAAAAQHGRWAELVRGSGLSPGHAADAIASQAFGPLTSELRRAEAHYLDIESLLVRAVAKREFGSAQDVAAVLRSRVSTAIARNVRAARSRKTPRLIAGLIPKAIGPMAAEMRRAIDERGDLASERRPRPGTNRRRHLDSGARGTLTSKDDYKLETASVQGGGIPGPLRSRRCWLTRRRAANDGSAPRCRLRTCRARGCEAARERKRPLRGASLGCHCEPCSCPQPDLTPCLGKSCKRKRSLRCCLLPVVGNRNSIAIDADGPRSPPTAGAYRVRFRLQGCGLLKNIVPAWHPRDIGGLSRGSDQEGTDGNPDHCLARGI